MFPLTYMGTILSRMWPLVALVKDKLDLKKNKNMTNREHYNVTVKAGCSEVEACAGVKSI